MLHTNESAEIQRLYEILFSEAPTPIDLRTASIELFEILLKATVVPLDDPNHPVNKAINLSSGKAISPVEAARCLMDYQRTRQFIRGIHAAISECRTRFPNEKIEILYAGCGPLATLALPICMRQSSDEIAFTLVDCHTDSIESAKRIVGKLGFADYVGSYVKSDVMDFDPPGKFHIIILEIMQRALETEPQLEVTMHLAPYLRENGVFIPEKVSIEAALIESRVVFYGDPPQLEIPLGTLLDLTNKTANLAPVTLTIPKITIPKPRLALKTGVTVFGDFELGTGESSITTLYYPLNGEELVGGETITFEYQMGERPGFHCVLI